MRTGSRPTVCQLLHGLTVGGAEVLAARLARQLKSEYRFVFACLDLMGTLGEELAREGFPVHVLRRRPGIDWRCAWELGRLLGQEKVALVHAHQYTPFFYGVTARLLCRRPAVLFTEHGRTFPDYPRPKRLLANRLLLERRDRVVGVGEAVRQALVANEGLPAGRVGVIYNGVDLSAFANGVHNRSLVRRELRIGPDDFVLLQVARLDALKDHGTALAMLKEQVTHCPTSRLVVVGEGPERPKIEALVSRLGLGEHVRLLGLRQDVARLLPAADALLLTSVSEGIPLTLIEGMAAGLPVIATDVGGVAEVVEEGVTGLLAAAGDADGLASQALLLAENGSLRRQMGERGRERAQRLFSEAQMHAGYRHLYEEMLHG